MWAQFILFFPESTVSQLWFLGFVCWQAGAEMDSIQWLTASITIAVCQDWVEQVAEVKMLRKKISIYICFVKNEELIAQMQ